MKTLYLSEERNFLFGMTNFALIFILSCISWNLPGLMEWALLLLRFAITEILDFSFG